jgi:hypothetical protein
MVIQVPRAEPSRTELQVVNAMQAIIDSNAVQGAAGTPASRGAAERVTTERTEFNLFL